ncbi:MAG: hypothetical protein Kow0074_00230 [Candidatus Zixiibacteriota bacterium]
MIVVAVCAMGCESEQPAKTPPAEQFPSSEAYNATTEFYSGPIVTTRIKSGRIVSWADQDSSWSFDMHVDFYDSTGAHTSTLQADSALIRELKRRLEVFGNVEVITDAGTTLESEHLAWDDSNRLISTDSFVVVTRGDDVMSGYGFRSDPELERIVFRRQVSGRLTDTKLLESPEPQPDTQPSPDTVRQFQDTLMKEPDDTLVSPGPEEPSS